MTLPLAVLSSVCCLGGLVSLGLVRRRLEAMARAEHELRGAAFAIALAGEHMRRDPAAARHAAVLMTQVDRLRAGLAALDAARTGRAPIPRPEPAELASITRAAMAPWEVGDRTAVFDWMGGPALTRIDRAGVSEALGNLMANAAEHGRGRVTVRGRTTAKSIRIEIRNANGGASGAGGASRAGGPHRGALRPGGPRGRSARPARGGDPWARGRGLAIAERAARRLGGRLLVEVGDEETVAVLELPRVAGGDEDLAA